jgi:hypothetical protein
MVDAFPDDWRAVRPSVKFDNNPAFPPFLVGYSKMHFCKIAGNSGGLIPKTIFLRSPG